MVAKVHAYRNEDNPIETACGKLAFDLTEEGELKKPSLLLISGDYFAITCRNCQKAWRIPLSYSMFREITGGHPSPIFYLREEGKL